jgi:hypothetical protein
MTYIYARYPRPVAARWVQAESHEACDRSTVSPVASKRPNKTVEAEIAATRGDEHYLERRDELVAMIASLQRAESPWNVMALQCKFRDRVAAREHHMADRRQKAAEEKAERDRLAIDHRPEDRDAIKEVERRLATLAWRATRYDRALFTALGEGTRVERFADEAGAKPERERAAALGPGRSAVVQ